MHASLHLALPFDGSPVYGSSANIEMTSCIWILTRLRKHVWNATHCLVHGPGCIGQSAHLWVQSWVPSLGTRYCFSPSPVTPPSRPPCLLPSVFPLIACDRPFPFPNSFLLSSKWWKKCLAFKLILWKSFFSSRKMEIPWALKGPCLPATVMMASSGTAHSPWPLKGFLAPV